MRTLSVVVVMMVSGCSTASTSVQPLEGGAVADGARPTTVFPVGPPDCDGTKYADLCHGYHYGYVYGVPATCTSSPYRLVEGGAAFRKNDPSATQDGCGTFSQAAVTCCAE